MSQHSLVHPDGMTKSDLLSLSGNKVMNITQKSIICKNSKLNAASSHPILSMHEACQSLFPDGKIGFGFQFVNVVPDLV